MFLLSKAHLSRTSIRPDHVAVFQQYVIIVIAQQTMKYPEKNL